MTFVISEKLFLAPSILLVRLLPQEAFLHKAGQHLVVSIPTEEGVVERAFSIASAPEQHPIELIVKVVTGGVASRFFVEAPLGVRVKAEGPRGSFLFAYPELPACFIASGTGIAPLRAMMHAVVPQAPRSASVSLHFSTEEPFLHEEFEELERRHPVFSRLSDRQVRELPGIVPLQTHFYLCGSPNFVTSTEHILHEEGVLHEQIHYEKY